MASRGAGANLTKRWCGLVRGDGDAASRLGATPGRIGREGRKPQEFLRDSGATFARRDYFKERFTVEELRAVLRSAGLTPREVLSKRAKPYKDLVGDRDLSDDELLELMVREPTLLRRPLAVRGGRAAVGFDREGLSALAGAE